MYQVSLKSEGVRPFFCDHLAWNYPPERLFRGCARHVFSIAFVSSSPLNEYCGWIHRNWWVGLSIAFDASSLSDINKRWFSLKKLKVRSKEGVSIAFDLSSPLMPVTS